MTVEELERELRAERPAPDPEFARRLDEWAAEGFPRRRGLGPGAAPRGAGARLRERLTSLPPRRLLLPVGAAATLLVVVGVVVSQDRSTTGIGAGDGDAGALPAPLPGAAENAVPESSSGVAAEATGDQAVIAPPPADGGGIARGADERLVDASAALTLGAEADRVQEVANDVVEVTDRHDGVVIDSQVGRDRGGARAAFELEIPYRELDATLTDLSGLADVISRTESGHDITAQAVRARKDLAATYERIRAARIELIRAETAEQRLVIRSRIQSLEATADAHRAELNRVQRQGRFATVSVAVTSDRPAGAGGDGWSLGEALDDAGRVLEVIAGIALVALAVLVPAAAIAGIAWLIVSRVRRRRREGALGS